MPVDCSRGRRAQAVFPICYSPSKPDLPSWVHLDLHQNAAARGLNRPIPVQKLINQQRNKHSLTWRKPPGLFPYRMLLMLQWCGCISSGVEKSDCDLPVFLYSITNTINQRNVKNRKGWMSTYY